jgi:Ca-activated chloride channel homolog
MTFLRPELLWLALVLPALFAACLVGRSHARRRAAVQQRNVLWMQRGQPPATRWPRMICVGLLLIALVTIGASIARPQSSLMLFADQRTIVLAMDVSGSMAAEDIAPSRMGAAQLAAKTLVGESPANVRIGLVAYGQEARVLKAPTFDRQAVKRAIDQMKPDGGTAIGDGIMLALSTIFEGSDGEKSIAQLNVETADASHSQLRTKASKAPMRQPPTQSPPAAAARIKTAAIVLLTDGKNSDGMDPMAAAQAAAGKGVRVFTVGFGTKGGVVRMPGNYSVRTPLDDATLKAIALTTEGDYFHAESEAELTGIYRELRQRLQGDQARTEVTALFAIAAAILSLISGGLSLLWFGRIA